MGQVNIRVADGRVEAVRGRLKVLAERLGISQGDVVERGLDSLESANGGGDLAQKIWERAGRIENKVDDLLSLGVSAGPRVDTSPVSPNPLLDYVRARSDGAVGAASAARERGFPMSCRHCRQGKQGPTKYASICFDCKGSGHSNDPAECPVCTDYGTGAL